MTQCNGFFHELLNTVGEVNNRAALTETVPVNQQRSQFPVAIVGYSYRMPGGIHTDDDFWHLLSKREIVQEQVTDRYGRGVQPIAGFSGGSRLASPYEGLIRDDDQSLFDRTLFGVSHNEMLRLEPQTRMLLTCSWEVLERVGWDLVSLRNSSTGVFIGAQIPAVGNWRPPFGANAHLIPSSSLAMLANRISYHFNLTGSSMTYCTACSSGLSALHSAMIALQSGDCNKALVGASSFLGSARSSSAFNALGVISKDGKCHSFDVDANGYMRSEGAFVFAIKPLTEAEKDGDLIHAVVEATAVNTAGSADDIDGLAPGRMITAPTRHAQIDLMRTAWTRAGFSSQDADYIEAHATGTVVGDRIEGNAIAEAFGGVKREVPLRVSSVKSNVGHLEAAAFHCSLLKVILMMQRRVFAPISKNFAVPNPEIDFESCPMEVQTFCEPFPQRSVNIGINSFGFGGANGHCVVREYRPTQPRLWSIPLAAETGFMIPLSSRNSAALSQSAQELRETVRKQEFDLYTLAGNLSRRRTHFAVRTSFAVRNLADLEEALSAFVKLPEPVNTVKGGNKKVAFVFSGQGTQWAGCGRALYNANPVFRRVIDAIDELWCEHSDFSLRNACFTAAQDDLNEVRLAQPAIFMIQCALTELLKTWGVFPDCVLGHSSGEVAAAYACGALSLKEATRLVFHRSNLQQKTAGSGRMLAIGSDRTGIEKLLDELGISFRNHSNQNVQAEVACVNAPASIVVCGKEDVLMLLVEELNRRNRQSSLLPGNIAFHSSAMNSIFDESLKALAFLDDCAFDLDTPFVSSVTGAQTERLDRSYWWSNIRQTVQFEMAMKTVQQEFQPDVYLEIAPHCALQSIIAQCLESDVSETDCIPTLMKNSDICLNFQEALGALFRAGVELDFAANYPRPEPIAHLLPGHPRDEQKLVDEMQDDEYFREGEQYFHGPMVGHRIPSNHLLFEARLSERDFPWLAEHRVHHASIIPAAGYIELILQALEGVPVHFDVLEFLQPCSIPKVPIRLQTALFQTAYSTDEFTFEISSRSYELDGSNEIHCRGKVRRLSDDFRIDAPGCFAEIDRTGFNPLVPPGHGDQFYEQMEVSLGYDFQYGPFFKTIQSVEMNRTFNQRAFCSEIEMDENLWSDGRKEGYVVCPPILDGGLQMFLLNLMFATDLFVLPLRAENVTFFRAPTSPRVNCYVEEPVEKWLDLSEFGQTTVRPGERLSGGLSLYDSATGEIVVHVDKYYCFCTNPKWNELGQSKHLISWQPKFFYDNEPIAEQLMVEELDPTVVVAALAIRNPEHCRVPHIVEFAGSREPDQTILKSCIDSLAKLNVQSEYWLVSDKEENARAHYDAFHRYNTSLRFEVLDQFAQEELDGSRLLRPAAAELVLLHRDTVPFQPEDWHFLRCVTVGGGLMLIFHDEKDAIEPGAEWSILRTAGNRTLLQASHSYWDSLNAPRLPAPRWILGETNSWATDWATLIDEPSVHNILDRSIAEDELHSIEFWPQIAELRAIDFFCGYDTEDPTGELVASRFISFIQALASYRLEEGGHACRVTVVTAKSVMDVENPRGAALWGAVRCMAVEFGEEFNIDFRLVDLGANGDLKTLEWLARCDLRERELVVRENKLWCPRMTSIQERNPLVSADDDPPYRLNISNPGQIAGLEMKTCSLPRLSPTDVEVDVTAAALNFRDVMVTLGLLPALAYERSAMGYEVGMEASGVIRRTGSEVRHINVGDEVVFVSSGCIANRVVVNQHLAFAKPDGLSMEEGASILSVYATAYYSLIQMARLKKGQRVLIHSAMGGVGQAAVALARHVGAEIYATAGSQEKREQLLKLGVEAAFDSHSFKWHDGLMDATEGKGVDVVLNSLAGRHIELCLQSLRSGGWHCEIGKIDIYADSHLSMRIFRKNLRFVAIDIDRLMVDDPFLSHELSQACLDLIDCGAIPSLPATVFSYKDYAKALRLMTTGKHQGKLVLKAPNSAADRDFPITDNRPLFDPDATYLITGAMGGLGLRMLSYLAALGARHLTLIDRDSERRRDGDWVRQSSALCLMDEDVKIDIMPGDVAVEEDVQRCVARLQRPLRGVFHLAGVLDDCLLDSLSSKSLAKVCAPKAQGALNLHRATQGCALDYFVLFSSTASVLGNPGQINYGAANGFLDGLAASRRQQGLPCLSYNLSAVADAGMAARNLPVLRMMRAAGIPPVSSEFAIANLDYALRSLSERDHIVTALFERPAWRVDFPDYMRTGHLIRNQDAFETKATDGLTLDSIVEQIAEKVAELCGHDQGGVDEPLSNFGLTSISVAELGTFIHVEFSYRVSALELMTTATCMSLAQDIIQGNQDEEEQSDAGAKESDDRSDDAAIVRRRPSRRTSSDFASTLEEHFPRGPGFKFSDADSVVRSCIAK